MMKKELFDLEYKIDFLDAKIMFTIPEEQQDILTKLKKYIGEYKKMTGKVYIPKIQRRIYESGDN